ncbi:MAG: T9SS type A sorting domain-containing protein [Bacteroidetes bacterium]|nr:T9SS C-terminal target domain-containing protein [Bacteroidota bacterium]NOG58482.1 T9SS type A sorting domain-containing protein [Bacteroidota bacterium]
MKRSITYLIAAFLLISSLPTKASHLWGGEIYWECLSNGKFVFHLNLYRDCSSSAMNLNSRTLTVSGSSLPLKSTGTAITYILVRFDMTSYLNENNGDVSFFCVDNPQSSYSCSNGDVGAIQRLHFYSDTIQMTGTPPSDGWTFFYDDYGRPISSDNILGIGGAMGIKAVMHRIPTSSSSPQTYLDVSTCADNSPYLAVEPVYNFCRGKKFSLTHLAQDIDLDSIVYNWDRPIGATPTTYNNYVQPYSTTNQFPDQSFNINNVPSNMNPQTGVMNMGIYNGTGRLYYTHVVRIDAFRHGSLISSVYRDIQLSIFDCQPLSNGNVDNPPSISFNSNQTNYFEMEVNVGEQVQLNINVSDLDINQNNSPPIQKVYLEPVGKYFSKNLSNPNLCANNISGTCVTLNPTPNQTIGNKYLYSGYGGINLQFNWTPTCANLVSSKDGVFDFTFKVYDDGCPIPNFNYSTLRIKLKERPIIEAPIIKGASVAFDGKITLSWVPPIDSVYSFSKYDMQVATSNSGTPATSFLNVQLNVKKYKQDLSFPFINFGPNLWTTIPANKDYYFRMRTKSGCSKEEQSANSDVVRVIEIESRGIGKINPIDTIRLTWNAPKANNAQSPYYYVYESPTRYYIWQNDDPHNSITDLSKWYLRGSTNSKTIDLAGNLCGLVGFRIEARDTVITLKQGSGLKNPQYDTLTFSTFSIVGVQNIHLSKPKVKDKYLVSLSANYNSPNFQWFNCNTNSIISGEVNQVFIPTDTGKYAVIINQGNCIDTSACYNVDEVLDNSIIQLNNMQLRNNGYYQLYQWIDCRADTIIPGENDRDFFPKDTGYYAVVVSAYGYSDTSSCIPMLAIGIQESYFDSHLKIYPNPTKDQVLIQSDKLGLKRISLRSINGQLIKDIVLKGANQYKFQLEVQSGIYIVELESITGSKVYRKIIKQ